MLVIASAWHPASINTMRREPEVGGAATEAAGAGADIARTIGNERRPSMALERGRPARSGRDARAPKAESDQRVGFAANGESDRDGRISKRFPTRPC